MAVLRASALDSLRIWSGSDFLITEMKDGMPMGSPSPGEAIRRTHPRIGAGPNGVDITSAVSYGNQASRGGPIHVRYEIWDAEPDLLPSWDRMWEGQIYLSTGLIGIAEDLGDPYGPDEYLEFDTGKQDSTWSARVLTRLLSNTDEPDFPANIVEVDLYRMQLWPPQTA
jgi:hypothetical protein